MNILYLLTSGFFAIWILRNTLFWVALWQTKEYRFDRMLVHLKETIQGKTLFFSILSFIKWIALFSYGLVILDQNLILYYQIFIVLIFFSEGVLAIQEIFKKLLKRPTFTFKSSIIVILTILIISIFFLFPLVNNFFWLLLLDRFLPLIIIVFILLLSIPTELYQDVMIENAIFKIKKHNNLLVIGITGSYGKSSTKEYIAQILGTKFRVLKTQGTNNTPIGVAQTIVSGLKEGIEIFVVEMGAYRTGEIAELCQIVHPKIGVLTGVNDQHISLFGSMENTMSAKYELISSLPKNGLSLFNGNNTNARELYEKTNKAKKKILYQYIQSYSEKDNNNSQGKIFAANLIVKKNLITFDVWLKNKKIQFKTSLVGGQNVENILPGIYIADYLGMTEQEIKKAVSLLYPLPKTMNLHQLPHGPNIIDDTFNANPASVLAVLDYLKIYKRKKILVLQPMIELGINADTQHYQIAKEIAKTCDSLFLTNKNFSQSIIRSIMKGRGKCEVNFTNPSETSHFILKNTTAEDVVVFEGKEAGIVLDKIL